MFSSFAILPQGTIKNEPITNKLERRKRINSSWCYATWNDPGPEMIEIFEESQTKYANLIRERFVCSATDFCHSSAGVGFEIQS
jgi:hypothetical protein